MENNYSSEYDLNMSCAYNEKDNHIEDRQHKIKQKYTVPFHKCNIQDELNRKFKSESHNIDNVQITTKKYEETFHTSGNKICITSQETCSTKDEVVSPNHHPIFPKHTR